MAVKSELSEQKLGYIREFVNDKDPKEEYKLIQSIGTGTYGEVYKALRLRTKELAAVKIIKIDAKDDVRAILQEIQTLRDCKHSNIVQFFGSYFRNNKLWICMEFCGGFSMQDIYTNIRRPVEENCIAFVTRETLRGIEYMHKAGKIHRDIKGANILLTNDGEVKIADFGVAAQITQTIQRRNSFIGTPYWMAPEVAAVERKGGYDEKCDIWALGITAMEYAELQPPLFDLHPMRALRILGMRSYKPPTLRNKAAWSPKFHSFLKAALTKSEKKRPTAQALLRHELVTQPHLSRLLTLKLLELNRNPDRLAASIASTKPITPVTVRGAQPPAASSVVRPAELIIGSAVSPPSAAIDDKKSFDIHLSTFLRPLRLPRPTLDQMVPFQDRTLVHNVSTKSSESGSKQELKRKASSSAHERPQPPEKMHTPWTSRTTVESPVTVSSSGTTPVNSPVQASPKSWVPAERITSTRQPSNQINGVVSNMHFPSVGPAQPKTLLEEIRIMDELPKPLPAYVPAAPTATPAPKPSGDCSQLLASGKTPKTTVSPATNKPPIAPGVHVPVEALVQRRVASSASPVAPTRIAISDSSTVASSGSSDSSNSSSCTSASTSPRSSCSSLVMESVQAADARLHANLPILNGHESVDRSVVSSEMNGNALVSPITPPPTESTISATQSIAAPEYLTVLEPVVLQGSLEAQFLPIDGEAVLLASQPNKPSAEPVVLRSNAKLSPSASTAADKRNSASSISAIESDSNKYSDSDDASSCDDLSVEGEDQLTDQHTDDSSFRGTVTTIDSVTSSSTNPNMSTESIPHRLSNEDSSLEGQSTAPDVHSSPYLQTDDTPPLLDEEVNSVAPRASMENADEWDLEIAHEELLAADGLLNLNRSRPDSLSDRISEFGFRIHGSEGEDEDEEEEDDEGEDYEFPDLNDENEITIPDNIPSLEVPLQTMKLTSSSKGSNPILESVLHSEINAHTVTQGNGSPASQTPATDASDMAKDANKVIVTEKVQSNAAQEFFPDKSGEELMSLLRQLKFAQKFAWLSGSAIPPTTLSALANIQTTKISLNGATEPLRPHLDDEGHVGTADHDQPAISSIKNEHSDPPASLIDRVQSEPPPRSPSRKEMPVLIPAFSEPAQISPDIDTCTVNGVESGEVYWPEAMEISANQSIETELSALPVLLETESTPAELFADISRTEDAFLDANPGEEVTAVSHEPSPSVGTQLVATKVCGPVTESLNGSVQLQHTVSETLIPSTPQVVECTNTSVTSSTELRLSEVVLQEHEVVELDTKEPCPTRVQSPDSATERRTSFSRTYPPRPEVNGCHQVGSKALMSSSQVSSSHPFSRAAHLRESDTSQPHSGSSGSRSSRFSMIELSHVNERPLHASCSALPPTPQVHMGACFSLVFEGCPLKINSTATWINPMNNGQVILFGTNDGIYFLNLKDLADSSLELIYGFHRGFANNLDRNQSSRRFSPSQKIPETKGCRRVSVTRSPFNGAKYLCAAVGNEILVMEWFNTISSFIKIKRVLVPDMPSPLLTFDLFIVKERPLPLVCLGVYRHHSRRGRENQRYRLHLVDLNTCAPFSPTSDVHMSPGPLAFAVDHPSDNKVCKMNGEQVTDQTVIDRSGANELRKLKQKAEFGNRNTVFLHCAKVINLNGRIKSSRHRATTLDFNGNMAESVVCLRDSILVFHPNGLLGKSFTGELTQEIHDDKHIYRLLGCDRNIIVESRPADDPMSNSNVYILAGHTDSYMQ
ncbi:M4K3 [Fasciola hepatica]|uniref:non-specific serine/threonine protein kinase n=1 Tax=Fasciola hepatica TaxID=6192 RepID=A0A4E0RBH0_FASHE|nr:M4K3 [Fasciola hepatica]